MPDAGASRKRQIQVTPGPFRYVADPGGAARMHRAHISGLLGCEASARTSRSLHRAEPRKPYFTDSRSSLSLGGLKAPPRSVHACPNRPFGARRPPVAGEAKFRSGGGPARRGCILIQKTRVLLFLGDFQDALRLLQSPRWR
jgi:hypothetical protein